MYPQEIKWMNPDYDFSSDTKETTIDKINLQNKNQSYTPKALEYSLYERNKKDIFYATQNKIQKPNHSVFNTQTTTQVLSDTKFKQYTPKATSNNKSFDLSFLSQNKRSTKKQLFLFDEQQNKSNTSLLKILDLTPQKQRMYFNPQKRPFSQHWMKSQTFNQNQSSLQQNLQQPSILDQDLPETNKIQGTITTKQNYKLNNNNNQKTEAQSYNQQKNRIFSDNKSTYSTNNDNKLFNVTCQIDTIKINDSLSKTVRINQFLEKDNLGYKQVKVYDESFSKILPLYSSKYQDKKQNFSNQPQNNTIFDDFENEMINLKNQFNTSPYNKLKQVKNYQKFQLQSKQSSQLKIEKEYIANRYRHLISLSKENINFVEQYFLNSVYQASGDLVLYENDEIRIEVDQELIKIGQFKMNYNLNYINKLSHQSKANQIQMFTIFLQNTQLQKEINVDPVIQNKTLYGAEQQNQIIQINTENFDFQFIQELIIEVSYRIYQTKQKCFQFLIPSPIMMILNTQKIDPEQFEAKWKLIKLGVGQQKFMMTSFQYDSNYIKKVSDIQRIFNKCVHLSAQKQNKYKKQKFGNLCFYKGKHEFLLKIIVLIEKPYLIMQISYENQQEKEGFKKFVQVGRAVYVNEGPQEGKVGVIVNILSQTKVQVDGENFKRQVIPINRLRLTGLHLKDVLLGQRTGLLRKKIAKFELSKKFAATNLSKSLTRQKTRANLSDFDRFKVMVLKKRLNYNIGVALKKGSTKQTKAKKQAPKKK